MFLVLIVFLGYYFYSCLSNKIGSGLFSFRYCITSYAPYLILLDTPLLFNYSNAVLHPLVTTLMIMFSLPTIKYARSSSLQGWKFN